MKHLSIKIIAAQISHGIVEIFGPIQDLINHLAHISTNRKNKENALLYSTQSQKMAGLMVLCLFFKQKNMVVIIMVQWMRIILRNGLQFSYLPNIPDNAVIIMDNAPYHNVFQEEGVPSLTSKKMVLQKWLSDNHITFKKELLRTQRLDLINIAQ